MIRGARGGRGTLAAATAAHVRKGSGGTTRGRRRPQPAAMAPSVMRKISKMDFYRKLPVELSESTRHGRPLSFVMLGFLSLLLFVEVWDFLAVPVTSKMELDVGGSAHDLLTLHLNVTMLDMPCEYATVDVTNVLGTHRANVTKNVAKWDLDDNGRRIGFQGRNKEQRDIHHGDAQLPSLEVLHANGVHAPEVAGPEFSRLMAESSKLVFVNFYAPWCVWCQRLAPVWEKFAEEVQTKTALRTRVEVIKVDCIANRDLCKDQKIRAFPSLRLYEKGAFLKPGYSGDRTVAAFMKFLKEHLDVADVKFKDEKLYRAKRANLEKQHVEHRGCLIEAVLDVKRVPGAVSIYASSKHHNFDASSSNSSHVINRLAFGKTLRRWESRKLRKLPEEYTRTAVTDAAFVNSAVHVATHHYAQVVSSRYDFKTLLRKHKVTAYQVSLQSADMLYDLTSTPAAKFAYRIDPIGVHVKRGGHAWYSFVTATIGIIGGTTVIFGLLNSALSGVSRKRFN